MGLTRLHGNAHRGPLNRLTSDLKRMQYRLKQKFPKKFPGILGPVRVEVRDNLIGPEGALGLANYSDRIIEIDADVLKSKDRKWCWKIFWHEVCHFWLEDTGVGAGFTKEQKEQLCDAYAAARVQEMR